MIVAVVQLPSCVQLFVTPQTAAWLALPVPHHLLEEFSLVHVHCISDAVQPSHPLTLSSPSAFNLSSIRYIPNELFCSHQITKILELQLQYQSSQ